MPMSLISQPPPDESAAWRRRNQEMNATYDAAAILAGPPPSAGGGPAIDYTRTSPPAAPNPTALGLLGLSPPPSPVAQAGRTVADYLGASPPVAASARPSAGGVISRGNQAWAVPAGKDYRPAMEAPAIQNRGFGAPPDLSPPDAARAAVERSRLEAGLTPEHIARVLAGPPPTAPADPGRALAARLVGDYSRAPGATMEGMAGLLDLAGNITAPPKVDYGARVGSTIDVNGSPYVFTQPGNLSPVKAPEPVIDWTQPPRVHSEGGFNFYQSPGEGWRPLREDGENSPALNPLTIQTTAERIAQMEQELAVHQLAMADKDNRYGFANLRSRPNRVAELEVGIAGKRAVLQGGRGGRAAEPAPAKPAAANSTPAAPSAKLYTLDRDQVAFASGADLLKAAQQALDDGVIDEAGARALLARNGYKPKVKPATSGQPQK